MFPAKIASFSFQFQEILFWFTETLELSLHIVYTMYIKLLLGVAL